MLTLDVIIKNSVIQHMFEHEMLPIIEGFLTLHYIRNPGGAYGLQTGQRWVLVAISFLMIMGILWYVSRTNSVVEDIALGFILGGALGNFINRVIWGNVIDFIEIKSTSNPFSCI